MFNKLSAWRGHYRKTLSAITTVTLVFLGSPSLGVPTANAGPDDAARDQDFLCVRSILNEDTDTSTSNYIVIGRSAFGANSTGPNACGRFVTTLFSGTGDDTVLRENTDFGFEDTCGATTETRALCDDYGLRITGTNISNATDESTSCVQKIVFSEVVNIFNYEAMGDCEEHTVNES